VDYTNMRRSSSKC